MSVAVSKDCGRVLVVPVPVPVPATRDMFMLGREGSAKERANEEKEGNVDVDVEPDVPDSPWSCFGGGIGGGGGWPSAFAQASRALCSLSDVLVDRMCRGCPQVRGSRVRGRDLRPISFPLTVTLRPPQARLGLGCGVAALPKGVSARYRSMDWVLECSQRAASVRNREMGTS